MRRRTLFGQGSGIIDDPSLAPPMSVVFANKSDGSLTIVEDGKWDTDSFPQNSFEPIGIVVIPGTHGVLKDGTGVKNQCGVMSLFELSCYVPGIGSAYDTSICFGGKGVDITGKSDGLGRYDSTNNGLMNYQNVVMMNSDLSNAVGYTNYVNIPSQQYSDRPPFLFNSPYGPSPYAGSDYNSGGYNEFYSLKNGVVVSEENNALSDFNGIVSTKILIDLATAQSDWKTDSVITNNGGEGYYPAACTCARYKTTGTKAFIDCTTAELKQGRGFWYLPAIGELGYILPRLNDIRTSISKLRTTYRLELSFDTATYFISSSEAENNNFWSIYPPSGTITKKEKNYYGKAHAFMRL